MEKYHVDARFMAVAAGAVWSIGASSGDKKKEMLDAGFIDMILDLLKTAAKDDPIVAWMCFHIHVCVVWYNL